MTNILDRLVHSSTTSGEWSSPPVTGTKPPPLYNFSFTKIDNRRAVVFGGLTSEGALGDAYVLELDKLVHHRCRKAANKTSNIYSVSCLLV